VFKNRVLKRIFVPKREEVTRVWMKFLDDDDDLYSSYIMMIKSKRMRWNVWSM
jgi:hypothetical protein